MRVVLPNRLAEERVGFQEILFRFRELAQVPLGHGHVVQALADAAVVFRQAFAANREPLGVALLGSGVVAQTLLGRAQAEQALRDEQVFLADALRKISSDSL